MEFGTKLKELRATKGVSQAKLAADIHISRSAVAKWENGLGLPNDESLRMLSEYFGIPVSDLIPDKTNAETIVTKNKTINQQKKAIIGLSIGCAATLFILAFIFLNRLGTVWNCWALVLSYLLLVFSTCEVIFHPSIGTTAERSPRKISFPTADVLAWEP